MPLQVTGAAQLVVHMFSRALSMDTMHPVNISGNPNMQIPIFGEPQPCLQAAAFRGAHTVVAMLNICNTTIPVSLKNTTSPTSPTTSDAARSGPEKASSATATEYSLFDVGGKAPLPADPTAFPWAAPLTATTVEIPPGTTVYSARPLSFVILELR